MKTFVLYSFLCCPAITLAYDDHNDYSKGQAILSGVECWCKRPSQWMTWINMRAGGCTQSCGGTYTLRDYRYCEIKQTRRGSYPCEQRRIVHLDCPRCTKEARSARWWSILVACVLSAILVVVFVLTFGVVRRRMRQHHAPLIRSRSSSLSMLAFSVSTVCVNPEKEEYSMSMINKV